ncbi:hypothetical protein K437DRAFT_103470 [Tilletiaria anomala UBC 951]|uniref:Uncharacterized protein n=1 Tax=Tilletiaria anomala (strain ATCC 24038 / CBS 436.72 / UBC 951) TaxID=1037660 RepID=A0A066VZU4_TILAU|nr:uncharacterized protein K437DRAFT_103470 [Tilletiaria anomala UBC 951]KDN47006.1 hypothetical protein K437DRAFT_103470 [Tilletiaria anomala UBC 951]
MTEDIKHCTNDFVSTGAGQSVQLAAIRRARAAPQGYQELRQEESQRLHRLKSVCQFVRFAIGRSLSRHHGPSSNPLNDICFRNPMDGKLKRTSQILDTIPGISRLEQVVLQQGRSVHLYLKNIINKSGSTVGVARSALPKSITWDAASLRTKIAIL